MFAGWYTVERGQAGCLAIAMHDERRRLTVGQLKRQLIRRLQCIE